MRGKQCVGRAALWLRYAGEPFFDRRKLAGTRFGHDGTKL